MTKKQRLQFYRWLWSKDSISWSDGMSIGRFEEKQPKKPKKKKK